MNLLDLTLAHVGTMVMLVHPEWTIVGVLEEYDVDHDVIYEYDLSSSEPVRGMGTKTVSLRVGSWEATILDPSRVQVTYPERMV